MDAALLTSPHNFHAEAAGFTNLGWTIDYAKELPFSGGAVNRAWASANKPTLDRFLAAYTRSVDWFQDDKNRDEAIRIMVQVSKLSRDHVAKSYDFLQQKNFYELTGKISKAKLGRLVEALRELGYNKQADHYTHFSYEMVALTPRCAAELGYELSEEDKSRQYP